MQSPERIVKYGLDLDNHRLSLFEVNELLEYGNAKF